MSGDDLGWMRLAALSVLRAGGELVVPAPTAEELERIMASRLSAYVTPDGTHVRLVLEERGQFVVETTCAWEGQMRPTCFKSGGVTVHVAPAADPGFVGVAPRDWRCPTCGEVTP